MDVDDASTVFTELTISTRGRLGPSDPPADSPKLNFFDPESPNGDSKLPALPPIVDVPSPSHQLDNQGSSEPIIPFAAVSSTTTPSRPSSLPVLPENQPSAGRNLSFFGELSNAMGFPPGDQPPSPVNSTGPYVVVPSTGVPALAGGDDVAMQDASLPTPRALRSGKRQIVDGLDPQNDSTSIPDVPPLPEEDEEGL